MAPHLLERFRFCPSCGSDRFLVNDFKSKRCTDCGFTYYFNAAAAVAVIMEDEHGRILACRRAIEPAKGTLDLVGGFVDPGESLTDAVVRETMEECSIDLSGVDLELVATYPNIYPFGGFEVHTCDAIFLAKITSEVTPKAEDDISECIWIPSDEIRSRLPEFGLASVRRAVGDYLLK